MMSHVQHTSTQLFSGTTGFSFPTRDWALFQKHGGLPRSLGLSHSDLSLNMLGWQGLGITHGLINLLRVHWAYKPTGIQSVRLPSDGLPCFKQPQAAGRPQDGQVPGAPRHLNRPERLQVHRCVSGRAVGFGGSFPFVQFERKATSMTFWT